MERDIFEKKLKNFWENNTKKNSKNLKRFIFLTHLSMCCQCFTKDSGRIFPVILQEGIWRLVKFATLFNVYFSSYYCEMFSTGSHQSIWRRQRLCYFWMKIRCCVLYLQFSDEVHTKNSEQSLWERYKWLQSNDCDSCPRKCADSNSQHETICCALFIFSRILRCSNRVSFYS